LLTGFDILVNLKVATGLGLLNKLKLGQVLIIESLDVSTTPVFLRSEFVEEKEVSVCFALPEEEEGHWKPRK
jgi:hypothetical protein